MEGRKEGKKEEREENKKVTIERGSFCEDRIYRNRMKKKASDIGHS